MQAANFRIDPDKILFILIFIAIALMAIWMSGCTSYTKCFDKYGHTTRDTITYTVKDTVTVSVSVPLPEDEITGTVNLTKIVDSLVFESKAGRARAIFWKDQFDSIRFSAQCLPDTITITKEIPYQVKVPVYIENHHFEQPEKEKTKNNSLIERIAMWIGTIVMIIVLIVALFYGGRKILETYFPALKILKWIK